jgi:hypothetical protein
MYALKCALKITIDGAVKSHYDTNVCHSRESVNPLFQILTSSWIPAFAGMTIICEAITIE